MDIPNSFMLAGDSIFTISNIQSGNHYTYRIHQGMGKDAPHFVGILTGPNNQSDYTFLGTIFQDGTFRYSQKSSIGREAPSVKGFEWLWRNVDNLPGYVRWDGCGYCHRCGRLLTDQLSIETGYGAYCRTQIERVMA